MRPRATRPSPASDATPPGADAGPADGGSDAGDGGGPLVLSFDPTGNGDPDAIYWDDAKKTLFIADNNNNQIWTWTDASGFTKLAQVPDNAAATDAGQTKLNGITELADGTLVVTRFGYGTFGAIYTISPDGGTATVPGVDPSRKRIEVTVDPATSTIYGDSFTGSGTAVSGAGIRDREPHRGDDDVCHRLREDGGLARPGGVDPRGRPDREQRLRRPH